MDVAEELMHWGILNMKWGVRRYQNPDGSLTPEGRIRYGVGPARTPSNVGDRMSDDELRDMAKRYKQESYFYNARNDYLKAQQEYKRLTTPQKKTNQFLNRVLVQPLENVISKNVEFGLMAMGAAFVDASDSKYTDEYMNWIFKSGDNNKKKKKNKNNYNNRNHNNWHNNDDDDDDDD